MDPLASLAADTRSLDGLRADAARNPAAAVRKAANQFEALFFRQVLKSMRDAMPRSGLWDSAAESTYTDLLDQQLAQTMAGRPGGLAEAIARQLSRNLPGGASVTVAGPAAQTGGRPPRIAEAPIGSSGIQRALAAGVGAQTAGAGPRAVVPQAGSVSVGNVAAAARPSRALAVQQSTAATSLMPDLSRLDTRQAAFVREMWPNALLAERSTGVPAAWIVGQAALESGWGRRQIRNADGSTSHNLFGIKAGRSWDGEVASAATTEYVDGRAQRRVERFRAYGSYAEAFADWAGLMVRSPRYGPVLRGTGTAGEFSSGLQKAGYATDPQYGAKLERIINQTLMIRRLVI